MTNVNIALDHATGEGSMTVPVDATNREIQDAVRQVEADGWEVLDTMETGDVPDYDDAGMSYAVPLVRLAESVTPNT